MGNIKETGIYIAVIFITILVSLSTQQTTCENPPNCRYPSALNKTSCSCYCTYAAHPDPGRYYAIIPHFPIKIPMPCPATLVWRQGECKCLRAKKTDKQRDVVDVVSSIVQCQVLADRRSNGKDFHNFDGYHGKTENQAVVRLKEVKGARVRGQSAQFNGNSLYLSVFEYNDLTGKALIKMRIHPDDAVDQANSKSNQILISDACSDYPDPAIQLSLNPSSRNFSLKMVTSINRQAECTPTVSRDGWYDVSIVVIDGKTSWTINTTPCPALDGSGGISVTECGMTVGGNPLLSSDTEDFYGFIDYFKVVKHCDTEPPPKEEKNPVGQDQSISITKPIESQSVSQVKPVDPKPVVAQEKPVVLQPVSQEKPVVLQPVSQEKPVVLQPVSQEKPVVLQPVSQEKPFVLQPVSQKKPVVLQPVSTEKPAALRPMTQVEPVDPKPVVSQEKPIEFQEKPFVLQHVSTEKPAVLRPMTQVQQVVSQTMSQVTPVEPVTTQVNRVVSQSVTQTETAEGKTTLGAKFVDSPTVSQAKPKQQPTTRGF